MKCYHHTMSSSTKDEKFVSVHQSTVFGMTGMFFGRKTTKHGNCLLNGETMKRLENSTVFYGYIFGNWHIVENEVA